MGFISSQQCDLAKSVSNAHVLSK